MEEPRPWSDRETLAGILAFWNGLYAGRELYRLAAGPDWVRLHLVGDERAALLLSNVPGARLILRQLGRLPDALATALTATPRHALPPLLQGARLEACGLLPDDRVAAFRLRRLDGSQVVLLQQLFGASGNLTLLDAHGRLLWSVQRPPHTALATWPPAGTFATADPALAAPPAAYDATACGHLAQVCGEQVRTRAQTTLTRLRKSNTRLLANLDRDLANADAGDLHRRKAEALAANLHLMRQGGDVVELADLTDGTPLSIALDPARTPAANMEAWFRRARKAARGQAVIADRRDAAAAEGERLEAADDALAGAAETALSLERLAQLQKWQSDHADLFPVARRRSRGHAPEEPARPFRRYLIDGRWEAWVGRNNKENDELTHRAAHNRDIWLHAQGVSGSHVILRTGGQPEQVPRSVLEKAAALAALNSKARHSQYVPVIHTEKRYVRKPRKAPAGTAVCLRDRSLFVEPRVMAGVEPA